VSLGPPGSPTWRDQRPARGAEAMLTMKKIDIAALARAFGRTAA
jgi:hypothetical protein